jgi:4-amino-4-deoxy-L-arabinose transferase-like glycosyltransferase
MAAGTAILLDRNSVHGCPESARCNAAATDPGLSQADGTRRIFWIFVGCHVVLWTAVQALTSPNRPLDMVGCMFWGRSWQWGYHRHPPLPAWIAETVFQLSAGADWPLYLVSPLLVAVSFWAAWTLAKEFLKPWPALCASTLLETCAYYNFTTADLNHTIVVQPFWALSALCLYRALTRKTLRYWMATGVSLGVGMLAKYDIAILATCMMLLPVINRKARAALLSPGPYLALFTSLAIFSPHVAWMAKNHFSTIVWAVERGENTRSLLGHVVNPIEFALSQLLALLPMLAIAFPLWRKGSPREARAAERNELQRDFLLLICLGPFVLDIIISATTGVQLQSMWGAPLWNFSGLCLVLYAPVAAQATLYRSVIWRSAVTGLVVVVILITKNVASPYVRHKPSRVHFPGNQLAAVIERQWKNHTDQPLSVVTGPWWPAANAGLCLDGPVQIYDFIYPEGSPWASDKVLRKQGGIIVWEIDGDGARCEQQVRFRFPDAKILPPFALAWQTGADIPPARFGLAIVLPSSVGPGNQLSQIHRE